MKYDPETLKKTLAYLQGQAELLRTRLAACRLAGEAAEKRMRNLEQAIDQTDDLLAEARAMLREGGVK